MGIAEKRSAGVPPPAEARWEVDDRRLVDRLGRGDPAALDILVQRYGPTAQALALCILGRPAAAEHATRNAFLSIWQQTERFEPELGTVRSWVIGVVHRRAVAARAQPGDALTTTHAPEVIGLHLERCEPRAVLSGLPTPQRSVIELMYFGGFSQSEVSGSLGIPIASVRSHCLGGMRSLRGSRLEDEW